MVQPQEWSKERAAAAASFSSRRVTNPPAPGWKRQYFPVGCMAVVVVPVPVVTALAAQTMVAPSPATRKARLVDRLTNWHPFPSLGEQRHLYSERMSKRDGAEE